MSALDPYLKRKTQTLAARRDDFTAEPEKSKATLKATARVAGNSGVRPVRMGEYTVITDSAPGLAGYSLGPTSPELLLGSLASCLVHTYLIQAALLNIPLDTLEIEVNGELDFTAVVGLPFDQPPTIHDITYAVNMQTSASAEQIQQMHDRVEATCPVLNTLRLPVSVTRK